LLKYGYSNFSLEILEYCPASELFIREKYYFKLLNPEYNIALEPGSSMLGRRHSEETRANLLALNLGIRQKKCVCSAKIQVTDLETNKKTDYYSMSEAAKALDVHRKIISQYISKKQQTPYKGRYIFSVIS